MGDFLRRSAWIFLAAIFVISSVGIVIASFVLNDSKEPSMTQNNDSCQIQQVTGVETLALPAEFKAEGDVTSLKSEDIQEGSGAAVKAGDCITVKYHGTLATSGTKFDGNFDAPMGLKLKIGVGQVIPGWDQGLIGMKEGGIRRLIIPSELAYGEADQGSIPSNSDLVFVVKLLKVE